VLDSVEQCVIPQVGQFEQVTRLIIPDLIP